MNDSLSPAYIPVRSGVLPTFLVIGAPKAGTTDLWQQLRRHPQICMAAVKETRFFSHDESFARGWQWYSSLFNAMPAGIRAIGEVTPHYSVTEIFPQALDRIATFLPHVKIIYCVRDPATAIPSLWKQLLAFGASFPGRNSMPTSFCAAIRDYRPIIESVRYFHNLSRYRNYFPDDRIHVVCFEDYARNRTLILDCVYRFLDVASLPAEDARGVANASEGKTVMPAWVTRLRTLPHYSRIRALVPAILGKLPQKLFARPMPAHEWTKETVEYVLTELAEDSAHLLDYAGKPKGFWQVAPSITARSL